MPTPQPIRVAVVGATGYTGAELIRYLARHPYVRLTAVTSEQSAGKALADVLPSVRGKIDLPLMAFDPARIADQADMAFTALPHGASAAASRRCSSAACGWSTSAPTSGCAIRASTRAGTCRIRCRTCSTRRSTA